MGNKCDGTAMDFFKGFIQSQDYWKEEIESTSKRWHDTVKRLSPEMYSQIEELCRDSKDYPSGKPLWRADWMKDYTGSIFE